MDGATHGPGPRPAGTDVDRLSPSLRLVARHLLFYKGVFTGRGFVALAAVQPDAPVQDALSRMVAESLAEGDALSEALARWDALQPAPADVAATLQEHVLEDLLALKEGTTEACLLVAMRAPTDDLRRTLLALADLDRAHADTLRGLLGLHRLAHHLESSPTPRREMPVGAHDRRLGPGSLLGTLQEVLAELVRDGQEPARIVLSPVSLRHLRDEGALTAEDGLVLGLPVDVDFGWRGECFAVRTRDHASLAEIVASTRQASP